MFDVDGDSIGACYRDLSSGVVDAEAHRNDNSFAPVDRSVVTVEKHGQIFFSQVKKNFGDVDHILVMLQEELL